MFVTVSPPAREGTFLLVVGYVDFQKLNYATSTEDGGHVLVISINM